MFMKVVLVHIKIIAYAHTVTVIMFFLFWKIKTIIKTKKKLFNHLKKKKTLNLALEINNANYTSKLKNLITT